MDRVTSVFAATEQYPEDLEASSRISNEPLSRPSPNRLQCAKPDPVATFSILPLEKTPRKFVSDEEKRTTITSPATRDPLLDVLKLSVQNSGKTPAPSVSKIIFIPETLLSVILSLSVVLKIPASADVEIANEISPVMSFA
jgi:hypothetical protein